MRVLNVLVRQHVPIQDIEKTARFYEALFGQQARLDIEPIPGQLHVTQIAGMLLVGASDALMPSIESIKACYLVEGIEQMAVALTARGATLETPVTPIATGRYMIVRHPDGMRTEYVEHDRKHPLDRMQGLADSSFQ